MLSFCKDKREAIKQLCILADYHKDCFDYHQQLLKTSTNGDVVYIIQLKYIIRNCNI
ncbi:hypothetical protein HanPI659440_Chr03g0116431 [Helianthus annuus]|nr:hypothetical protein HanPI659440_Chr03g0116431 [Helianthus annuus]